MNTPDKSSILERSPALRCFRSLFTRRVLRRELIVLAWFVTLLALFHGEETWRGRRAWNQYRRGLEAQGGQLDFAAVVPKPVPDEQNFAATPFIKSWFEKGIDLDQKWNDSYARVAGRVSAPRKKGARAERRFEDLAAWETAFATLRSGELTRNDEFYSTNLDAVARAKAAPAVLEGLRTNEALFAELRAASQRPYSRYPVNYDVEPPAILLPHFRMMKGVSERLRLKACAELAGGQSDQALEDVKLMFRLADSVKEEPFLISHLVRLACAQIAVQPIWEGLAEHRWSEAQLQVLETRLQQYSFIADLKTPLAGEQAAGIATIELVRKNGLGYLGALMSSSEAPLTGEASKLGNFLGFVLIPQGWYDQEELNYCRGFQVQLATVVDTTKKRVSPAQVKADAQAFEQMWCASGFAGTKWGRILYHRVMVQVMLPTLGRVVMKPAAAQTAFNQAAVACALERYRLAKGWFPGALETLVPQFISPLPNDVLTGEPYKYRVTDDGRFVLYSVGWDEKDDGGVPGKKLFDEKQGDWVWEYPAK